MLTLDVECGAVGRLRHRWLENQILNKEPDDVVYLRRRGDWPALEREFANRVRDTLELAGMVEACFSPAQLVDRLRPFRGLPSEALRLLREAVHKRYLGVFPAPEVSQSIRSAAEQLGEAIEATRVAWREAGSAEGEAALAAAWRGARERAVSLLDALNALPRGVVLP